MADEYSRNGYGRSGTGDHYNNRTSNEGYERSEGGHNKSGTEDYGRGGGYNKSTGDDKCKKSGRSDSGYDSDDSGYGKPRNEDDGRNKHKDNKHKEQVGEIGAFTMYEKQQVKKDPENAHRRKIEEEVATVGAVGSGGYTFREHHEKMEYKESGDGEGKKKHHFLG